MSNPTPAQNHDAVGGPLQGQDRPRTDGPAGPIPEDNQPGHHPAHEQDKPDLDAFAAKLGVVEGEPAATEAAGRSRGRLPLVAAAVAVLTAALGVIGVVLVRRRRDRHR